MNFKLNHLIFSFSSPKISSFQPSFHKKRFFCVISPKQTPKNAHLCYFCFYSLVGMVLYKHFVFVSTLEQCLVYLPILYIVYWLSSTYPVRDQLKGLGAWVWGLGRRLSISLFVSQPLTPRPQPLVVAAGSTELYILSLHLSFSKKS